MSRCWAKLPDNRPDFSEISLSIEDILYEQDSSAADEESYDYAQCLPKSIEHDYTVPKPETEGVVIDDTSSSKNHGYIDIPVETPI